MIIAFETILDSPTAPIVRGLEQGVLDRGRAERVSIIKNFLQPLARGLEGFLVFVRGEILNHQAGRLYPAYPANTAVIACDLAPSSAFIDHKGQGVARAPARISHLFLHKGLDIRGAVHLPRGPPARTPAHSLGKITPPCNVPPGAGVGRGIAGVFPPDRVRGGSTAVRPGIKFQIGALDGRPGRDIHAGEAQPDPVCAEVQGVVIPVAPAARGPLLGVIGSGRVALAHGGVTTVAPAIKLVTVFEANHAVEAGLEAEKPALVSQVVLIPFAADQKTQRVAAAPAGLIRDLLDHLCQIHALYRLFLAPVGQGPGLACASLRAPGEIAVRGGEGGRVTRLFGLDLPFYLAFFIGRRGEDQRGACHGRAARDADALKAQPGQRLPALRLELLVFHGQPRRGTAGLVAALEHPLSEHFLYLSVEKAKTELVPGPDTARVTERRGRGGGRDRRCAALADHVLHHRLNIRAFNIIAGLFFGLLACFSRQCP